MWKMHNFKSIKYIAGFWIYLILNLYVANLNHCIARYYYVYVTNTMYQRERILYIALQALGLQINCFSFFLGSHNWMTL